MAEPGFDLQPSPVSSEGATLRLFGDWTISGLSCVEKRLADLLRDDVKIDTVLAEDVRRLDTAGAFLIDRALRKFGLELEIVSGSDRVSALLYQARHLVQTESMRPLGRPSGSRAVKFLERIGRWAVHLGDEFKETLSFLGETLLSVLYILLQPWKMRWTALVSVMEDSGLDAVPIVAFLSFFVGMVVAFIGASTLAEFGATIFVVELVGIAVLREFGVVLAAIILVGRTNSAFTAQIGAMKMRQEIDAMTTLGLDPMDVIVAPRVLAMVLMTPVLAFVGVLAGLGGGVLVGWLALDINPTVFFGRMQDFVPLSHFWVGMSKAPFFGLVIALIGCRQGLQVGGSVQSLGQHTTKSVVQAIFAIIVIDALFAILYMELDI
jgi:phospholipid/cholesterol/gamma-HCH transport system permease protein